MTRSGERVPALIASLDGRARRAVVAGGHRDAVELLGRALDEARRLGDGRLTAALFGRLGRVYEDVGDVQDAVLAYESGYRAWAAEAGLDPDVVVADLGAVGKGFARRDETSLPDPAGGDDDGDLARTLADPQLGLRLRFRIGTAYLRMRQDGPAAHALERVLVADGIAAAPVLRAHALTNLGIVLRRREEIEAAKRAFDHALRLLRAHAAPVEARCVLSALAGVDRAQGRTARARRRYEQALALHAEAGDPVGEGRCLANLAMLRLEAGDVGGARDRFEGALARVGPAHDTDTLWWLHWGLGRCHHLRGDLDLAAASFGATLRLVEAREWQLRTDEGKVSFLESVQVVFDELIAVHAERGDFAAAAETAERARGRSLGALMRGRRRHRPLRLPPLADDASEEEVWRALRSLLPDLPERPYAGSLGLVTDPDSSLDASRHLLVEMAAGVAADPPPEAWVLLRRLKRLRQQDAQRHERDAMPALDVRQAAVGVPVGAFGDEPAPAPTRAPPAPLARLLFHVGADRTVAIALDAAGAAHGHVVAVGAAALAERIAALRRALRVDEATGGLRLAREVVVPTGERAAGDPTPLLRSLYDDLVAPLVADLPPDGVTLVLEPHGPLWLLPFAALVAPDGRPLADRWPLLTTPSLAALDEIRRERDYGERSELKALIVGNPTMPARVEIDGRRWRLDRLPGAEREATAVAALFGHGRATHLPRHEATPDAVSERAFDHGVLHLATHGVAFADDPLDSFVALAGAGPAALLSAREVLDLACPADLVTLSACQTGLGFVAGEGVIGLSRSFLIAGARSVLVSLWSVDDGATEALMVAFYGHYLAGDDKPVALQKAMRAVRANPATEHPRSWAPFVLVGAEA